MNELELAVFNDGRFRLGELMGYGWVLLLEETDSKLGVPAYFKGELVRVDLFGQTYSVCQDIMEKLSRLELTHPELKEALYTVQPVKQPLPDNAFIE